MVDLRDIISQKYLGLQFHEEDLPRNEDFADLLYDDFNCSITKGNEESKSGDDSQDFQEKSNGAILLLDNDEETDNLAEGCRRNLFKNTSFWMKTELLLLRLQEQNLFSPEILETNIDFGKETENCYTEEILDWNFQNTKETEITRSRNFQSSLKISETSLPKSFEAPQKQSFQKESSRYGEFDSTKALRTQADNFRNIFLHLIKHVVKPCDDKIQGLITEILGIRRDEGELISLGSGTCNEISIISENLRDKSSNDGVYWQARLARCTSAIQDMCVKMEKTQNELALLETWFTVRSKKITDTITRIRYTKTQILEDFRLFYESNASHEIFRSKDLKKSCRVDEFKKKTIWYSEVNVEEFENTLAQNLKALVLSNESIDRMIKKMHEYLAEVHGYSDSENLRNQSDCTLKTKEDSSLISAPTSSGAATENNISATKGTPAQKCKNKRKKNRAVKTKKAKKRSSTQFA